MNNNEILKKIETYMKLRNWSIYKLAKEADIPYSSLNSMFLKNTQPTIPTLEKICSGLNISMSDFFSDKHAENIPYMRGYTFLNYYFYFFYLDFLNFSL